MAERPLAPLIERAELVDFDGEANPPSVLKDRAEGPIDADAADRCAPDIPLVEEAESVLTEVEALLAAVAQRWTQSLCCFAVKNFAGRYLEAFVDSSEIQEMLRGSRDID